MKTKFFLFITINSFLFLVYSASGQPVVTSASGSFTHRGTVTISGNNFGVKSPAAPLHWDDGEDKTVDSPDTVRTQGGYSEVWSPSVCGAWRTAYKNSNSYRAVAPPHSRSTKYLGGGHKDNYPDNDACNNVLVTVAAPSQKNEWFLIWYERYSSDFPIEEPPGESGFNQKAGVFQTETTAYNGQICQVWGLLPFYISQGVISPPDFCTGYCNPCNVGCHMAQYNMQDIRADWQHNEVRLKVDGNAFIKMGQDNRWSADGSCAGPLFAAPRSWSIGGFLRYYDGEGNTYHTCNNAWRYFDDIYADNTFSRVMLANNQNYTLATIVEPQIPSAWSNASITVRVNLGRLPTSGTAYLFVFDANNSSNPVGRPITIGGGGDVNPPQAPHPGVIP